MIADGLWIDRGHRLASPHQPRRRRECLGELVQIDGSEHAWFEDRGERCTLLAFVDDATSRLMQLLFVASESAFDYFRATTRLSGGARQAGCLLQRQTRHFPSERQGGPRRGPHHAVWPGTVGTEHRHHLREQPAGEGPDRARVWHIAGSAGEGIASRGHLNDRAANAWLPAFMVEYNARFGRDPENAKDLHRKLTAADDLSEVLAWRRNGRSRTTSPCITTA